MIKEKIVYTVRCDKCGRELHDGDVLGWTDEDSAVFIARESEWEEREGEWLCPVCLHKEAGLEQ